MIVLASVTVSSNRADIIGDALRSVESRVHLAVILDLGITDRTLNVAQEIMGSRLRVAKYDGPMVMADMRNAGNDVAHSFGATWACTVDTDERLDFGRINILKVLEQAKAQCLLTYDKAGNYPKERFFRLPATARFTGGCHERTPPDCPGVETLHGVTFTELPKTPEVLAERYAYIEKSSREAIQIDPNDSRAWFHLGDALAWQGRHQDAIVPFLECANICRDPGEAAWACFRMAVCYDKMQKFREGIQACADGLTLHPGCAELAWWAGYLCLRMGQPEPAIYWARMALANGKAEGIGHLIPRLFFSSPIGQWEGPYEVLALAQDALGHIEAAEMARLHARKARKRREAV